MKPRFLSPTLHGVLDYTAAAGLIVLPFLLNLTADSPIALWLSVGGGAGLILYSLLTDYAFGVVPVFSYDAHLILDLLAAAAFLAAPFIFGFSLFTTGYYFVMAAGVLVVVAVSRRSAAAVEKAQSL